MSMDVIGYLAGAMLLGVLAHSANKRDIERAKKREEELEKERARSGTELAAGDAGVNDGGGAAQGQTQRAVGRRAGPSAQERFEERYPLVELKPVDLSYRWYSDGGRDPELDIAVVAHSEPVGTYLVNLARRSCTCEKFKRGRGVIAADQQGRLCKHLLAELGANGRFEAQGLGRVLLEYAQVIGWVGGVTRAWFFDSSNGRVKGHPCLVVQEYPGELEWVGVCVIDPNRVGVALVGSQRYGWSLREERWAYGEAAPGAMELKPLLRGLARQLGVQAAPRRRY